MVAVRTKRVNGEMIHSRPGTVSASEAKAFLFPDGFKKSHHAKHELRVIPDNNHDGSRTEYISIDKLKIDYTYQRMDISTANVNSISRNWDWGVYTPILVSERDNGDMVIVDGQHRWMAATERGDIKAIKCEIHKFDSIIDEAKAFFTANKMKKSVSAFSTYNARLVFNDPVAIDAKNIAYKHGYSITKSKLSESSFCGIGSFIRMVLENKDSADVAFGVCADIANGRYFNAVLLRGVYTLYNKFKDNQNFTNSDWVEKLCAAGEEVCMSEISKLKSLVGKGGQTVEAKALLDIINKRKRNRFEWTI